MESFGDLDEIIVGTNEEFILGYSVIRNKDGKLNFQVSFTNHSHNGRIKQVAISGKFLLSGSTDEFIRIFDLKNRREVGYILSHNGTVTSLQVHDSGFVFSGSEDGTIGIFKKGKWELEKELKGHTEGVNGVAIHPSGKLALSIGKDRKVFTWDLMKGKRAHVAGLKKAGEYVLWSPDGTHYLIATLNILNIYSIENANIVQSIDFKENIYSICYITDNLIVIGGEKKNITLFDLDQQKEVVSWEAHETRTKSIILMESETEGCKQIVSSSSDGFIKVWLINLSCLEKTPKLLGSVDTKCRIICMCVHKKSTRPPMEQLEHDLCNIAGMIRKKRKANFLKHKASCETRELVAASQSEAVVSGSRSQKDLQQQSVKSNGGKKARMKQRTNGERKFSKQTDDKLTKMEGKKKKKGGKKRNLKGEGPNGLKRQISMDDVSSSQSLKSKKTVPETTSQTGTVEKKEIKNKKVKKEVLWKTKNKVAFKKKQKLSKNKKLNKLKAKLNK